MHVRLFWFGAVGLLAVASACNIAPPAGASSGSGIRVVSTVTQVSALVRAVGGNHVQLTALLKPSDDPHAYNPHPSDINAIAEAKLIVESGAGLDRWMDKPVRSVAPHTAVLDASRGLALRAGSEGQDPHWWYDVDNAKHATDSIAAMLGAADASNRQAYLDNATAEKARLDDADRQVHAALDPIPVSQRLFVANHDAFNYFLARYDVSLVGDIIPSTDSLSAVRPQDTAKLIAAIRARHVRAIFTETTLDSGLAQQVARETGAKVYDGKLYGDAIGDPGTDGATLEGAIAHDGKLMAAAFSS